ncbi:hypothetical protein [Microtetraspora niveoalba]|uniref:hypothetical protein n=1 Tax=Microtetraspora niveoalba TaxID=46175 RepID=UPI000830E1F8|nr:hypothetical protein [Microtetraspora niveoalba]
MAGFEIYVNTLRDCAGTALAVSHQFKSEADEGLPYVGNAYFGVIDDASANLAKAVGELLKHLGAEIGYAENSLVNVESALHQVADNVANANKVETGDSRDSREV